METPYTLEMKLLNFLHALFPESIEIPDEELIKTLQSVLEKASNYGFDAESDFAIYIITAYLLGVDFDTEFPVVNAILSAPGVIASQKAENLQNWTHHFLHLNEDELSLVEPLSKQN